VARGIQFERQLKFKERLLELSGSGKPVAPIEMIGGGAQLGALEAIACATVVGVLSERVRVLGDRPIVFLTRFGFLPELESRRAQPFKTAARTTTDRIERLFLVGISNNIYLRGIWNANSLSARFTFPFRFAKEKVDVPPLRVGGHEP
jgi:hypothetical protein